MNTTNNRKIKPEDISIVFCVNKGYTWSSVAIETFQYTNPEYKDSVVIFNDNFNLIKRLKKYTDKIITWKNFEFEPRMLHRVSNMYKDCAMQLNTKYICFIDNDSISIEMDWFNKFVASASEEDKIIGTRIYHNIFERQNIQYPEEYKEYITAEENRLGYFCLIIDNEYFSKEYNINGYFGDEKYYEDIIFDIGAEFYYFCLKNKIPIKLLDYDFVEYNYLFHVRPNPNNPNSGVVLNGKILEEPEEINNFKKQIMLETHYQKALKICSAINFDLDKNYRNYPKI